MPDEALIGKAVSAALSQRTLAAQAKECGVSIRTLQRLRQSPEFLTALQEVQSQLVKQVIAKLTVHAGPAADTLRKIFSNNRATDGARVAAAARTLHLCLEAFELGELSERIAKLEESLNHEQNN